MRIALQIPKGYLMGLLGQCERGGNREEISVHYVRCFAGRLPFPAGARSRLADSACGQLRLGDHLEPSEGTNMLNTRT